MARKNVTFFQTLSKFSDVSVVSKEKGLSYIHIYTWMNYLGNVEIGRSKKGKKENLTGFIDLEENTNRKNFLPN